MMIIYYQLKHQEILLCQFEQFPYFQKKKCAAHNIFKFGLSSKYHENSFFNIKRVCLW